MLNEKKIAFAQKLLLLPQHAQIMLGESTHQAALELSARGTTQFVTQETWVAAVSSLLPSDYNGNLISELPNMYQTAFDKQLGWTDGMSVEYEPGHEGPIPLGPTKDDRHAFLHQRLNTIKLKTAKQLATAAELLDLAPSRFWRKICGDEDTQSGYRAHPIADALIQASIDKGKFDPTRARGVGTWIERGAVIRNFSGPVPERGWYIYTRFEEFETLDGEQIDEQNVLSWVQGFNWKLPNYSLIFFAWLCYAPICGALRQRPHMFLTGMKNSGKTTLLQGAESLLDPLILKFDGSTTTEAGIRQKLEENARPIYVDEFETNNLGSRRRIMDLARSAFSANAAGVKGTPSGRHMEFLLTTTFLFAGITALRGSAADSSRMFMLELLPHNNDQEKRNKIEAELQRFQARQTNWCQRRIDDAEITLEAIKAFEPRMPGIDSRAKRNLSIVFGSAFVALNGCAPTEPDIDGWIEKYNDIIFDHVQAHEQSDPEDCLSYMMSHIPPGGSGSLWTIVESALEGAVANSYNDPNNNIQSYGLRVEKGFLFVSDNHGFLTRLFAGSKWADGGWRGQLLRLEGAYADRKYFNGIQQRCVGVPLDSLQLSQGPLHSP